MSASFNVDTGTLMDNAAAMFNGLWPVMGAIVGLSMGIGLVTYVAGMIRKAF